MMMSIIEKELKIMFDARIIVPLRYSLGGQLSTCEEKEWGNTLVCGFLKSQQAFPKRQLPLPKMDHILQRVVGAHIISLLDGYFGYNQIVVCEEDEEKTTFTTPWGTFM
jgi:hypothetical protein